MDIPDIHYHGQHILVFVKSCIVAMDLWYTWKSGSFWKSLQALIFRQNSSISASGWLESDNNELLLGNSLSSKQTPAMPRDSSFETRRRAVLKLPVFKHFVTNTLIINENLTCDENDGVEVDYNDKYN